MPSSWCWFNSSSPTQNGRQFVDDIFKRMFLYENIRISIKFHRNLSSRSNLQAVRIDSGSGLVPNKREAITGTNTGPVHWRIYAPQWGDDLLDYRFTKTRPWCSSEFDFADLISSFARSTAPFEYILEQTTFKCQESIVSEIGVD